MKRKNIISITATVAIIAVSYFFLNTRLGVHIYLDVLSEIGETEVQTAAVDGPLKLTAELKPQKTIQLPKAIQQPSGIQLRGDTIYISTDQTEIFVLDNQLKTKTPAFELVDGPLLFKQGMLEAIEQEDNRILAIGEFGAIYTWTEENGQWNRSSDIELPEEIAEIEFSGIARKGADLFACSEEDPIILDIYKGTEHELLTGDFLKVDQDLIDLEFSGLAYESGHFFLLTESHTSIIIIDADTFSIKAVLGIQACAAADIAVNNGVAHIVIDHNYSEERPPMQIYDLKPYITDTKTAKSN